MTADQKREGMARPRWTIGDATEGWLPTVVLEDGLYFCRTYEKSDAERIVAALNTQAPPPPAEPPTLTPDRLPLRSADDLATEILRANQFPERYPITRAAEWSVLVQMAQEAKTLAAAPPPQPETLAADAIVERCAAIVESSPTLQKHIQLCFCPECTYVRGNVTEIRALKGTLALAQPEKVTPPSDAPGGEK
jgi:hypothetical protein